MKKQIKRFLQSHGPAKNRRMFDGCRIVFTFLLTLASFTSFILIFDSSANAQTKWGNRFALVIGNSKYDNVEPLANPVRDAEDITRSLKRLNFKVFSGQNLTKTELSALISEFKSKLDQADTVLFYYAGHGFQLNGQNYLVPVDAKLKSRDGIENETVSLNSIIDSINNRKHQTIIFLDACRNNPLPASSKSKSDSQGLAQVQTGNGTFIAFATQPGNITRDGRRRNSPFTRALLTHIDKPQTSISDLMISVRNEVDTETLGAQTPWIQSSLFKQFYFNPEQQWTKQIAAAQPQYYGALNGQGPSRKRSVQIGLGNQRNGTAVPGIIISGSQLVKKTGTPEISVGKPQFSISVVAPRRSDASVNATSRTRVASLPPAIERRPLQRRPKPFQRQIATPRLVKRVQRNLRRLGCLGSQPARYGKWGTPSELALGRYFLAKKEDVTSLSLDTLDNALLRSLEDEEGSICSTPPTKVVKRQRPRKLKSFKPRRKKKKSQFIAKKKRSIKKRPPRRKVAKKKKKIKLRGVFR